MFNKITFLLCCCFFLSSCFLKTDSELTINFSSDSSKIVLSGVQEANLYQLKNNLSNDSLKNELVSVVELAEDGNEAEKIVSGKLLADGSVVYFIPDTPFVKGHTYWVSTLLNANFATKEAILKADVGHSVKSQEKMFKR